MSNLPATAGLLHLAAVKRDQAAWCRTHAKATKSDPRMAHENEVRAAELTAEADQLAGHAKGNAELILNIETLIHYLNHSPINSADRVLALRHLEDASMRLRREIGDAPQPN